VGDGDQLGAAVELPPPPLPSPPPLPRVWPKRLWVLVLVTAVVAPLIVWLFMDALAYEGGGDFGGMGAMSAVVDAFLLLAVWGVALVSRLRRSRVRRRRSSLMPSPPLGLSATVVPDVRRARRDE
jgi:predicted Na+-dependent transporter